MQGSVEIWVAELRPTDGSARLDSFDAEFLVLTLSGPVDARAPVPLSDEIGARLAHEDLAAFLSAATRKGLLMLRGIY